MMCWLLCWWLHFSVTFKIYIISHSQAKAARKGNFKGMFSTFNRKSLEQAREFHLHTFRDAIVAQNGSLVCVKQGEGVKDCCTL